MRGLEEDAAPGALAFPNACRIRLGKGKAAPMTRFTGRAAVIILTCLMSSLAAAQEWPLKPVRLVSPFAPGGSSDIMGRILAENLSERLQQQFIIENRGGAGGLIGSAAVAGASPDGYTFLISSIGTHVIAPLSSANPPYDPVASFANVAFIGGPPIVIAAHPSLGVKSFQELLSKLKAQGTAMPYVSPGPATVGNLIAEFWAEKERLALSHVAYKGAGQAMTDLIAGHVQLGSITWTAALGQIRAGAIVPLAVSSARRMPEFPDIPTLKELGYPDLVVTTWFGLAAPANLPGPIGLRMNREVGVALDTPKVRDRLRAEGFELEKMSPSEMTLFVRSELEKWRPLVNRLSQSGTAN
jgi:tripartite-type tricarboxylate transporter receptor subunit TctC